MGKLLGIGLGVAGSLLGGAINNNQNKQNQKRNFEQNKYLQAQQYSNQMGLNKQGQALQMQTWRDTNYPAQMAMIKEAGLNPALLYGQGGAGGATTGSQGGGSASGASQQQQAPYEIGNALQGAMVASQIQLAQSQAEKNKAEADSIRGEKGTIGASQIEEVGARIEKIKAETSHEAVKQTLTQAEKYLKEVQYDKTMQESVITGIDLAIKRGTWQEQMEGIKAAVANTLMDTELKKMNMEVNEEQKKQIIEGIKQRWWEIGVKGVGTIINGVIGTAKIK